MQRLFAGLPVHRKLVALALVVSTAALVVALLGLTVFDVWRYRLRADDDAATLAGIIAENSAAAVTFEDRAAAEETLSTVRVRNAVTRACIYLPTGELFATYERGPELVCPSAIPTEEGFFTIGAAAPIVRNGRSWGTVYVERDFSGLAGRIGVAAAAAAVMAVLSGILAFLLAQWLTRGISGPIVRLAAEARRVRVDEELDVPEIPAAEDEVGDLVRAFQAMLVRVREANAGLRREIEERKKVEAQREVLLERERELNRMKDEFVATVAHELRTPLNPILGWAQILKVETPDEATLSKAIDVITRNVQAQARIIEDLVDVSRIATGKLRLRREIVDLRRAAEASVELARSQGEAKGMRLVTDLPAQPCVVEADPDRLRQVVGNLLSNAVKFSEPGGRVFLTIRQLEGVYELEVRDEGSGIAPEVLPHVFDRFHQADSSTTRHHGGLGLGLAIVKEVTELHGGTVEVASDGAGRGASFRVRLPAAEGAGPTWETDGAPREQVLPRLEGVRALVVDDNEDALEILAEVLRGVGAEVRTASSGPDALKAWDRDPPDVLLCDLAMPRMDGFSVLAELRERNDRSGRRTAAIAVSAHGSVDYRRRSLEAGFLEHVTKPYRVAELVQIVKEALET